MDLTGRQRSARPAAAGHGPASGRRRRGERGIGRSRWS